eukprot:CAMPEP_0197687114 /NCGR_PEP_ID=MMETSP1338-20131121/103535_1 /TAXON_ID=43686 ORGANISM="Pelagodinium beii, Strain RCC1491" /NCGR_SAMPLE_ID=MMETSP1338 /ASSEMBLY_ACC=CAM_ASM_000754 /LENGTH=499 /DNA_ID=CAMNT_0043269163 /DNA_START=12 /DNA_END=1511 /DNA_ORIENTATION=-
MSGSDGDDRSLLQSPRGSSMDPDKLRSAQPDTLMDRILAHLAHYEVPRMIRIKAPPLQVPNLVFQIVGVLGVAQWLFWNLHFMQFLHVTESNSFVELTSPQKNFAYCHDADIDCDDVGRKSEEPTSFSYCSEDAKEHFSEKAARYFFKDSYRSSGDPLHEYSEDRWDKDAPRTMLPACHKFDKHDLLRDKSHGQLLVTAITTLDQERCADDACLWQNKGIDVVFVENIERFFIKLRHNIQTEDESEYFNSVAGFILQNGEEHLLPCEKEKEESGACSIELSSWKEFPDCGEDCFSTGFADFIPLKTLLEAADISLDQELTGGGNLTRRWWGTNVLLDIEYSNINSWDFWLNWWPKPHMRYTYNVSKLDDYATHAETSHNGEGQVKTAVSHKRQLVRYSGVNLIVRVHGQVAQFYLNYFLRTMAVFVVVIQIAVSLVDTLVLRCYRCLPGFTHLPAMYRYFRYSETLDHQWIKDNGLKGLKEFKQKRRDKFHAFLDGNEP